MASNQRGLGSETVDPLRWTRAAETLSRLLLPDEIGRWLPTGSTLTIVPHGPLGLVPFAALPFGGELLGARFGVNYAPSLATLIAAEERRPARVSDAPLVVGNPLMPSATLAGEVLALRPLPGAESEARWVSNLLRTEALLGGDATEEAVAARLPAATLIHLATHGYAYGSDARVRESFVALAPGAGQDGVLTLGEILDALPPLRAELVVLSACQTGLGDLRFAEGVVGLQRGLLARGARSVLVSLWNVDDDATAELMRGFYLHWTEDRDQPSKAEALRRAQAEVRAMPGFEHPRFWAAFQLVGAR
jgi:CHAT domain-containing protein